MNEIIHFLLSHWILTTAFLLLLGAILYVEIKGGSANGVHKLSSQQAVQLINHENALLVDVRDQNAYLAGHIINAIYVPPSELSDNKKLVAHKDKIIIIVCSNGMQAPGLVAKLIKQGFTKVRYLAGGISAWKNDNLPTVK